MLANLVCSLIQAGRVQTTLQKAKAARSIADKMVTLGKKGTLHHRRQALSILRQEKAVRKLFSEVAPRSAQRNGGYTRIIKLGQRIGDGGTKAFLEFVDQAVAPEAAPEKAKEAATTEAKPAKKTSKSSAKGAKSTKKEAAK